MIPSIKLITALRQAAARIEQEPDSYCWEFIDSCNCGQLAKCALNVPDGKVISMFPNPLVDTIGSLGSWSDRASDVYCHYTALPMPEVFARLAECGLEKQDYENIEYLRSPAVAAITGPLQHDNPAHVAKYFRAQADLLEAELPKPNRVEPPECCHMWVMDVCLYCCTAKPVEVKELV